MIVDMPVVDGVPMPVVDVVDVITVWHRDVSTALAVLVAVCGVLDVHRGIALVEVPVVRPVQVSVVRIVDVVAVGHGDVPAARPVLVLVAGVLDVGGSHDERTSLVLVFAAAAVGPGRSRPDDVPHT
ncbi:hypothetical protein UA75_25830 [Actinoalloteichus sp. GBA129-24]|uniref:Uncharacterized protein n=1 Tax=Actinoalloteichus fjordicus TaxID=1612552 RepID=A0AAC9PUG3_9PSEU|nr:hypothetical protein UA74_25245 [Actinoalloteichus fjordicus]APU23141.1 hypothetical protein UA75_25830 [Actinoalloteichus sp. GBA129-24]